MKNRHFFILIQFFLLLAGGYNAAIAQESEGCSLRISILTASPGNELYSTFGHSAIRVVDTTADRDVVFNYGTFNFEEPNFYMKFIRGKLNYFISAENFQDFQYEYQMDNRSITEQVLNISCKEKEEIKEFLLWNLMPANRNYKYDFTFDNCTTRLGDIVERVTGDSLHYPTTQSNVHTFRDAIHSYLNDGHEWWSKLGIDILLGGRMDKKMTNAQFLFLPNNLMDALDSTNNGNHPIVLEKEEIVKSHWVPEDINNITTPIFIFLCLFVIIGFLSFSKAKWINNSMIIFDKSLIFLDGLIGLILLFMWFGTDHIMTKDNYNLLWAWPINIIAAFFMHSTKKWGKTYFLIFALFQIFVILLWFYLPQKMNIALLPIVGVLIYRSLLYARKKEITHVGNKDKEQKDSLPN